MRAAVIADIHSNLTALLAVLQDAEQRGIDELWCLGDIVGYGPDPSACLTLVRDNATVCLAGNHDLAAIEKVEISRFNAPSAEALRWTTKQLSDDDRAFLGGLPSKMERDGITFAHASPRDPIWEYVMSGDSAMAAFQNFTTRLCFVGHSHVPFLCIEPMAGSPGNSYGYPGPVGLALGEGRAIINPGSVGQPRDHDPRASYLIYDSAREAFFNHRVAYNIPVTQERMQAAGLPEYLARRLSDGT